MEYLSKAQLKALRDYEVWQREHKRINLKDAILSELVRGDYASRLCLGKQMKDEIARGVRRVEKPKGRPGIRHSKN